MAGKELVCWTMLKAKKGPMKAENDQLDDAIGEILDLTGSFVSILVNSIRFASFSLDF